MEDRCQLLDDGEYEIDVLTYELRAVGVGAGVSHREQEWLVVGELEVLVGKLLAVDGLAARALCHASASLSSPAVCCRDPLRYHG